MTPRPLALRGYLRLAAALAPVWRWGLQRRLQRGKETHASIQQKLSLQMPPRPAGPLVWGHAVGVGESMALAGLFHRLGERRPELHFLITTTARTSGDALQRQGLPPRCQHQFAPVDTPDATARFMAHWRPSLALWSSGAEASTMVLPPTSTTRASSDISGKIAEAALNRARSPSSRKLRTRSTTLSPRAATFTGS